MAEKEYIERGEMVRLIHNLGNDSRESAVRTYTNPAADRDRAFWNGSFETMCAFEKAAKELPAADVVEVRHGEWVDNHCTVCGMMPMGEELWDSCEFAPPKFEFFMDYCPNCGAKMAGGKTE